MTIAVVVAGGPAPDLEIAALLPTADVVIAADAGVDHCRALGLVPDMSVGDLDSISPAGLDWVRDLGTPLIELSVDKDASDLDVALTEATAVADAVIVIDSGAGRFDHLLGNQLLLASARFASVDIVSFTQEGTVTVGRGETDLRGTQGDQVSLLAVGGGAHGVATRGLRWPLTDATLETGSTWGVSNEFTREDASVRVGDGVLLIVQAVRRRLPERWYRR